MEDSQFTKRVSTLVVHTAAGCSATSEWQNY